MSDIPTQKLLEGCRDISIYLGNVCNFNCTYCDRDYIKTSIGGQHMTTADIPKIVNFLRTVGAADVPPDMISFHGGEPFSYVKVMDKIIEAITEVVTGEYPIFIQTNGSQITQNEWFFEKWGNRLTISISYDFLYQDINRTLFDINAVIILLKRSGVRHIQFQYVMPIHDPKVFSLNAIRSITSVCFKHGINHINLIPLRHIRGKDKFRVIVEELNIRQFFDAFVKFVQMLYVMGIDVVIDGHSQDIDKQYFDNHKQLVLSPDGYIYPEYDFLEYKRTETSIGTWKSDVKLERSGHNEDTLICEKCVTCNARSACGLKYLHKLFDSEPGDNCVHFYTMLNIAIKHSQKLKQKPNLLEWIGI